MTKRNASINPPFWRDKRIVPILLQLGFGVAVISALYYIISNALTGLNQLGIQLGFDFLNKTAGFSISESMIEFQPTDTYMTAFIAGLLNTLRVAFFGIILASIAGLFVGIARLSGNWLLSRLAHAYIEIFRNTPLLVQMFIWYYVVFLPMPQIEQALKIGPFYFSNRGTAVPWISLHSNSLIWGIVLIGGSIISILLFKFLTAEELKTGKRKYPLLSSIGAFAVLGAAILLITQTGPFHITLPTATNRNFVGGYTVSPGFSAVLLGLVIYTSTFIAEIIRAGITGVGNGQKEAAKALGLKNSKSLRLVIFPQAIRIIIPPLTSQYLNLIKNSSLAVAVGYQDIVSVGNTAMNQTGRAIEAITIMIAVYLTFSLLTSIFMNYFNKRTELVER